MEQFHYHLSYSIDQDSSTATNSQLLLRFLLSNGLISEFLITIWYHNDDCANNYSCKYHICLLSFLSSEFDIFIYRAVGYPAHVNDSIGVLNVRDKHILKLLMSKILNTESISGDSNFTSQLRFQNMNEKNMLVCQNILELSHLYFIL